MNMPAINNSLSLSVLEIREAKQKNLIPKTLIENPKAWDAAKAMEGQFFKTLFAQMFPKNAAAEEDGGIGAGNETWREMAVEQYANAASSKMKMGLAPQIYREMLHNQEVSSNGR